VGGGKERRWRVLMSGVMIRNDPGEENFVKPRTLTSREKEAAGGEEKEGASAGVLIIYTKRQE